MAEAIVDLILLDEDDDDDESSGNEGEDEIRIRINVEDWKRLGDPQFAEHFRMNRATFEVLLVTVGNHLRDNGKLRRRSPKGLDFSLMMVLWILATPDTFRSVGTKFGVRKSVVHFHYCYIIEALRELAALYVKWPNMYEREVISGAFEALYGYPSVGGCIDGCLIRITAPLEQPQQYVDRHHDYSITLQGVCDHNLLFRDAYVGQPGSVGDKRTFARSPLGRNILRRPSVVGDKHLLGDGGYTLTSKLMIPYRNNGRLTRRQRTHNYVLSRCRATIERAFALLKGKWRRLKFFPSYCLDYTHDHIMACIVLHNFIILEGESYPQDEEDVDEDAVPLHITDRELLHVAKQDAIPKRDLIAALLDPRPVDEDEENADDPR